MKFFILGCELSLSFKYVVCCWSSWPQGAAPRAAARPPDYVIRSHYTVLSRGRSVARGGKRKFSSDRYRESHVRGYDTFVIENHAFNERIFVLKSGVRG